MIFRKGTLDGYIFSKVCNYNEYKIKREEIEGKNIIDIGGHIGSFSWLCLKNKVKKITVFEPDNENFNILKENLKCFNENDYDIYKEAIWRSDIVEDNDLKYSGYYENTGGGNVFFGKQILDDLSLSIKIQYRSLDDILKEHEVIDLLKIDCEFSEFPIILTSKDIFKVKKIIGEFHEIGGKFNNELFIPKHAVVSGYDIFTINELKDIFEKNNFKFKYLRNDHFKHLGIFWAEKKE